MSTRNAGTAIGRLAADPRVFATESGARKVLLTVMVDRDFKNRETGERDSDAIPIEAWVRPNTEGLGVYGFIGRGDLVAVSYVVRSAAYPNRETGEMLYRTALVVEDLQMLESKTTTQQRRIARLQSALQGTQGAQQPEPVQTASRSRTSRQKAASAA